MLLEMTIWSGAWTEIIGQAWHAPQVWERSDEGVLEQFEGVSRLILGMEQYTPSPTSGGLWRRRGRGRIGRRTRSQDDDEAAVWRSALQVVDRLRERFKGVPLFNPS